MDTTSQLGSLWLSSEPGERYPELTEPDSADVAVIGGGIAGVSTALRLQQAGASVALLEARTLASGVTGCNTAKVTALQATMLATIASRHSAETAAVYAQASLAGVADVADLVAEAAIDCGFERRPAVTYAADGSELSSAQKEFDVASAAGLPVRWRDSDAGLPYATAGAVWLEDQVFVDPVRYVRGLGRALTAAGGRIFEHSRVLSVGAGTPCEVRTADTALRADQVVVATHYPILDRGLFFARIEAKRSYCIAARIRDEPPATMAISAGSNSRSIQRAGDLLIVGGEGHSAGAAGIGSERYDALERFASEHWQAAHPVARWSAQDPVPYDHLPMVGPLVPRSRRLWVATGWSKWGLSGGTFAARILADEVLGRPHEWARHFTPSRLSVRSTSKVAELGAKFNVLLAVDRITPAQASSPADVPPGEARVLRDGLGKTGAYRDHAGVLHAVSLRCTHLGCLLRFNAAERSWDCPCHGSRFDVDGQVLEGPAVHPLARREPSER